jgi:hypothetical protein
MGEEPMAEVAESQQEESERARARLHGDRRCPECGVKLSQYNPGPNCWQHTIGWPWRGPSAKPRFF